MADLTAPKQSYLLGQLANMLRGREELQAQMNPTMMGALMDLILPSSQFVEKLSYGDPMFRMPPSGTGGYIPITADKQYAAEAASYLPGVGPAARATTQISNQAADALVRAITRNPQATATRTIQETSMPFMQAVAPKSSSLLEPSPEVNLQMAREQAERLGMSTDPNVRMGQMGFETGWYHGTTGDVERFRKELLGEATGAESARGGFFFARDPIAPPEGVQVSPGSGSRTASGYSQIGGDREYREAMRKASLAEKKRDWDEYEKQMLIAEKYAIGRLNESQEMVAKHGEKRDEMLDAVQKAFYNKPLPQAEAEALDARFRELMPYGWYTKFEKEQFDELKQVIKDTAPEKQAEKAIQSINDYLKVRNEARLLETTQSGSNVIPAALRYSNPMVYDFKGSAYREQTYADLVKEAQAKGHDALILRNTFDPGAGKAELVDVGVVFEPNQIRSKFAAFDPTRLKESNILAGMFPITMGGGLLGSEGE